MSNTLETQTIEQLHTALVSCNSYMWAVPEVLRRHISFEGDRNDHR